MAQYTQINPDALVTALAPINNSLGGKQDRTDNTLSTTDKTISGAINEINTKVGNLTGALTWKGKFDTLPAVTDYEAGNVVGVGNKEYVLTITGSTKAWEELGDEGSYLLKSVAEETYAKKTSIPTVNDPKVSIKMNGAEKGSFTLNQASAGEVDLGTVITAHQDISGKVDKTLNAKAFEAITIRTTNSAEDKAANVAAIKAYVNNLKTLGVDTTKILSIPVCMGIDSIGNLMYRDIGNYFSLTGMVFGFNDMEINYVYIGNDGSYSKFLKVYDEDGLETSRQDIVSAINEVNTLARSKGNGTITGVKMNGVSKGTSGVVDLGNVATSVKVDNVSKTPSSGVVNLGYVNKQLITSTASTMTLSPNIYYRNTSTSLSTLTIKLGSIANSNIINEYFVEFTTSSSGTTISLPSAIKWANGETPTFEASTTYQISIVNNLGVVITFK